MCARFGGSLEFRGFPDIYVTAAVTLGERAHSLLLSLIRLYTPWLFRARPLKYTRDSSSFRMEFVLWVKTFQRPSSTLFFPPNNFFLCSHDVLEEKKNIFLSYFIYLYTYVYIFFVFYYKSWVDSGKFFDNNNCFN